MTRPAVEISDMTQDVLQSLLRGTAFLTYKGVRRVLPGNRAYSSAYAMECSHVGENGTGGLNLDEVGSEHSRIPWCCPHEGPIEGCDTVAAAELGQPYALIRSMAGLSWILWVRFRAQIFLQNWGCQV
jgi:hypothetical protein